MGKVLRCGLDGFVEFDLDTPLDDVWTSFKMAQHAADLAIWATNAIPPNNEFFAVVNAAATSTLVRVEVTPGGPGWDDQGSESGPSPPPVSEAWQDCEVHYKPDGTFDFYIGGSFVFTGVGDAIDLADRFIFGNGQSYVAAVVFFDDVKIGTSRGASDLFADDFASGNLSAWTLVSGDATVVDDPLLPPSAGTAGVSIALDGNALSANPTFVRIDDVQGVNVANIQVKRGRPDERSKTSVGTASVNGFDMVGDTDPTNPTGPWYGKLNPVKQATVNIYNPVRAQWSPIFTGYTEDWEHVLDVSERKLDFSLTMVDMLEMLNSAEIVPDRAGNTVPGESKGDVYYTGQAVDERLYAVLEDTSAAAFLKTGWPSSLLDIFSGNVNVQGRIYANRTSLLQVIDEACDAESPGVTNRFAGWDGVFNFRGRYGRYTPNFYIAGNGNTGTPREDMRPGLHWHVGDWPAAESDDTLVIPTAVTFTRGLTNLINASLVTPAGIADTAIAGQFVYDKRSVGKYGPRTEGMSYENIIVSDGNPDGNDRFQEAQSFGVATVDNYKEPVTRVSKVSFRNPPAGASDHRAAATWALLCEVELSDLMTITTTHPGGGGFDHAKHFVEGITYDIRPLRGDEWDITLTLDLSPADYYDATPNTWQPPAGTLLAGFTTTDLTGSAPLTVDFTDTSSADNTPGTYLWEFGDGTTSAGVWNSPGDADVSHIFSLGGRTVRLTITDANGGTSSACCYVEAT